MTPHSPEWMEALHRINPVQAELAKNFIKRAGHAYVCTTCGDAPLGDFFVKIFPFTTLRLCSACLDIYARTYGAQLAPVVEETDDGTAAAR